MCVSCLSFSGPVLDNRDMIYRDYAYESPMHSDYYDSDVESSSSVSEDEDDPNEIDPDLSTYMYI